MTPQKILKAGLAKMGGASRHLERPAEVVTMFETRLNCNSCLPGLGADKILLVNSWMMFKQKDAQ